MGRILRKAMPKGFTLVELLIVVAIIGVLSSIGVPTFRRMVTKSKKSEARVALGGLFTAESAFFTEYNTYGTRVRKVGFELEGTQRLYTVGFPNGTCGDGVVEPDDALVAGNLKNLYPGYFKAATADEAAPQGQNFFQRGTTATADTKDAGGAVVSGLICLNGEMNELTNTYKATATGNIAPGSQTNGSVTEEKAGAQDVWTINEQRQLTNVIDGIN